MKTSNKKEKDIAPRTSPRNLIPFDEFDDFFDDFLSRRWPRLLDFGFHPTLQKGFPNINIIDHDDNIEVQAELPGVNKEDLDVSITNQSVTIRASRSQKEEKEEEDKYFRREICRGEFQRTFSLPENIDSDNAQASFKNGLLTLIIPKTEESRCKRIEIK